MKHCGLGGLPHEQMLKGFPDALQSTEPEGRTLRQRVGKGLWAEPASALYKPCRVSLGARSFAETLRVELRK